MAKGANTKVCEILFYQVLQRSLIY